MLLLEGVGSAPDSLDLGISPHTMAVSPHWKSLLVFFTLCQPHVPHLSYALPASAVP